MTEKKKASEVTFDIKNFKGHVVFRSAFVNNIAIVRLYHPALSARHFCHLRQKTLLHSTEGEKVTCCDKHVTFCNVFKLK